MNSKSCRIPDTRIALAGCLKPVDLNAPVYNVLLLSSWRRESYYISDSRTEFETADRSGFANGVVKFQRDLNTLQQAG